LNARDYLDAIRHFPVGSVAKLTSGLPFVVLAPHPDDETLGTGGLIAAASAAGQRAEVVVVTDGAASHPRSKLYPRQRLVELRRREVERAALLLGLRPGLLHQLGFADTKAPISGPDFEAAIAAIAAIIRAAGARTLFAPWIGDPHCDHDAVARMALALRHQVPAIRLWAYPVWGWHLDPLSSIEHPTPRGFRLDISRFQRRKRAALDAHASQLTDLIPDDKEGFRFSEATLAPFLGAHEYFIEVTPCTE
jgi:LmbE family N-acetylglucosaminyl deacetylase